MIQVVTCRALSCVGRADAAGIRNDGSELAQVPAHDLDAAAEALSADLVVQAGRVHAALVPPALQIGLEAVDLGLTSGGLDQQLVEAPGTGEAAHGAALEIELTRDLRDRAPGGEPLLNRRISLLGTKDQTGLPDGRNDHQGRDRGLLVLGDGFAKTGVVAGDRPFDRLAEVVPEVPAIGNLHCLGRARASALRVGASSVSADDLDARMLDQSITERLGLVVGQQVDGLAGVHVHEHRAVELPTTEREVIDAQDPRGGALRFGNRAARE